MKKLNLRKELFYVGLICFLPILLVTFSCKKSDKVNPSITLNDSSLEITSALKTDVNEYDISYQAYPQTGQKFSNIYLHWSSSPDFKINSDSTLLSSQASSAFTGKYHLAGLNQHTTYYGKLSIVLNGQLITSPVKQFLTDSLLITSAFGLDSFPLDVNRNFDQNSVIWTNFKDSTPVLNPDTSVTRVFLGNYECKVTSDEGKYIFIHIPTTVPPDSIYSLKLVRKKLTTYTPKAIHVLKGLWSVLTPPVIPLCANCQVNTNGIGYYGTCYSDQNGYMLGGNYFYPLGIVDSVNHPENDGPFSIRQFNGQTQQWTEINPVNPRIYFNPLCYYYNNAIYVIGGQLNYPNEDEYILKTMWRFDIGSKTWIKMDTVPYKGITNMSSFQYNGEWYIGMGIDTSTKSLCCGTPLPSSKFWKYNPGSNLWTRLADFPGPTMNNPTCFTIGNQAYAFYGGIFDGEATYLSDYTQQLWKYDPAANSWKQIPLPAYGPLPGEKYQIVPYNGKAYFLTAQARIFIGYYYGFQLENSSMEYDPVNNTFRKISNSSTAGVMKLLYNKDDKFYFQSEAFGYIDNIPNITNKFIPDL